MGIRGKDDAIDTPPQLQRLLTPKEAAVYLRASPKTLANWRWRGGGATLYESQGAHLLHPQSLDTWLESGERTSTSDPGQQRPKVIPLHREQHG